MKKVIRTITAAALLISMNMVSAKEPVVIVEENKKNIIVEWDTRSEASFISLSDGDGNIIYSEHLTDVETNIKKLNLNKLTEGNYFLSIENSIRKIDYTIVIEGDALKIMDRAENTKAVFRTKNEKVFLNLLNLEKDKVRITVFDSADRVVFEEIVRNKSLVQKAFNFEDAFADTYTIRVNDGTDTFYESILIK